MTSIHSPRGTRDLLPQDQLIWQKVREQAKQLAAQLGYLPISTPTYEELALFQRSIGEGTDVIDKELFLVRGKHTEEEQYALRPEGTAGIVRAFIQHGMQTWPQPVKLYSLVNLFRYDRPQKGRYREHTQFDIEYFGDKGAFADAWVIFTTWQFLQGTGLRGLQLKLNSLGTSHDREQYRQALIEYYTPLKAQLSPDSQKRLHLNPLRLLDSKDESDQKLGAAAPRLTEYLNEASRQHFQEVQQYLQEWKLPVTLDPFLVRGLDYYSHTAFEWVTEGSAGQQSSLGGGGRYDGLLTQLDGPDVGAVGAGIGLDRVIEELERQNTNLEVETGKPDLYLVAADQQGKQQLLTMIPELINRGVRIDCNFSKEGVGSQLKAANRAGASYALVVGEKEASSDELTLKNLQTGEQTSGHLSDILKRLTTK